MTEEEILDVLTARAGWAMIPDRLREDLNFSDAFAHRAKLDRNRTVTFGPSGASFDSLQLSECVRQVLQSGIAAEIPESGSGTLWTCRVDLDRAVLAHADTEIPYPLSFALHPNRTVRIAGFEVIAREAELSPQEFDSWAEVFSLGALSEGDIDTFNQAIAVSPASIAVQVRDEMSKRAVNIDVLVPSSEVYYRRLVGALTSSATIEDFISNELREKVEAILSTPGQASWNRSLMLGGHQHVAVMLARFVGSEGNFGDSDIPPDLLSRLTLLETYAASQAPDLSSAISLSQQIRVDANADSNACSLLEALFTLVEGRLARSGTLNKEPPFWRRLASLTHAALLWRAMPVDLRTSEHFQAYLLQLARFDFAVANMLDLVVAPRWLPSYANAGQLRAEVIGRAAVALKKLIAVAPENPEIQSESELWAQQLTGHIAASAFFPGPCEGALEAPIELAESSRLEIERELRARPISIDALRSLFANSLVFQIDGELSKAAVDAVRELTGNAAAASQNEAIAELLPQLAQLAAVTRDQSLFSEIKILCRLIRRLGSKKIDPLSEFEIILISCAAWPNLMEYRKELGEWLLELSLSKIDPMDARNIHDRLNLMVYLKPDMWPHLSSALAATEIKSLAPSAA